jgi:hypothetical protein
LVDSCGRSSTRREIRSSVPSVLQTSRTRKAPVRSFRHNKGDTLPDPPPTRRKTRNPLECLCTPSSYSRLPYGELKEETSAPLVFACGAIRADARADLGRPTTASEISSPAALCVRARPSIGSRRHSPSRAEETDSRSRSTVLSSALRQTRKLVFSLSLELILALPSPSLSSLALTRLHSLSLIRRLTSLRISTTPQTIHTRLATCITLAATLLFTIPVAA